MRFSVLPSQLSPIAVDIGTSSVKMLQITGGESPTIHALAELEVPETIRGDLEKRFGFLEQEIPGAIRAHGFKGRRVVCAPLASQVLVQPVQVERTADADESSLAAAELESQLECIPGSLVVRAREISQGSRDGRAFTETLCWAMAREDSMRYVDLFKSMRSRLVGMHPQVSAMVQAFSHLSRRSIDSTVCTMYVDLGWGGMKISVAHGNEMVFAKQVQIGGRQLDGLVADSSGCDMVTARMRRINEGIVSSPTPASAARDRTVSSDGMAMLRAGMAQADPSLKMSQADSPAMVTTERRNGITPSELVQQDAARVEKVLAAGVDCSEIVESMADELKMCARYHGSLFGGRKIDRVVFLGGEARSTMLCRRLAESLNVPAQLGDPIARFAEGPFDQKLPDPGNAAPGWAAACGLCTSPVDF
jgi:Tfp pilus assembly PilM family ATPase